MDIFGICIKPLQKIELFEDISAFSSQKILFTPNPEILLRVKNDYWFWELLQKADYLTSDGIGLYVAYQILDSRLPFFLNILALPYYFFNLFFRRYYLYKIYWERITWNDLTKELLFWCEKQRVPIIVSDLYNPTDLNKVSAQNIFLEKMREVYPKLEIDFFIWNTQRKEQILEKMKNSKGKILFSTLWMKAQEENVLEIMKNCPHIKLGLWVGSSFDSITGLQKRAPKLWRDIGLEWLYRLVFWPQKLKRLKRLWNAIFVFIYEIYKEKYQIPNTK